MIKTYAELILLPTFEERFSYCRENGFVGKETFGFDRYLNQAFYTSSEWKQARRRVILRDSGCDLAVPDRPIMGRVYVHHLNPITPEQILDRDPDILNPSYLVCVSFETHQAIGYGDGSRLMKSTIVERKPFDTAPWKTGR